MSALFSKRVLFAAAKLALFYVALVVLEIVAMGLATRTPAPSLRDVMSIAPFLSIPFAFAFLLLAVARRWGFVAFWTTLGTLWVLMTMPSRAWMWPVEFPVAFISWSILALPLWIIGHAGLPRTSTRRISSSMLLLICWAVLLVAAQFFVFRPAPIGYPNPPRILALVAWIWAPFPLMLSAFAIRHVWLGTAKPVIA